MKTALTLALGVTAMMYGIGAQALPIDNLLANPGFENGLNGWTTLSGDPHTQQSDPSPHSGQFYVYGPNTASFSISQDIDLLGAGVSATEIDNGTLGIEYGGWQNGWHGQQDYGEIFVIQFDAAHNQVGSASISNKGAVSWPTWVEQSDSTALLSGTRFIEYLFVGTRVDGADDDAYLDDANLQITSVNNPPPTSVPEPSPLGLLVVGVAALGLMRWRQARGREPGR